MWFVVDKGGRGLLRWGAWVDGFGVPGMDRLLLQSLSKCRSWARTSILQESDCFLKSRG